MWSTDNLVHWNEKNVDQERKRTLEHVQFFGYKTAGDLNSTALLVYLMHVDWPK